MSNAAPQPAAGGEPTMEEILASIRRIISEEETEPALKPDDAPAAAAPPPPAAPAPEPEEDIFELTNVVADEPPPAPKPRPMLVSPADDIGFDTPPPAPAIAPDDTLVSDDALDRASAAFARLDRDAGLFEGAGGGGPTIESMVRDMVKPLLKLWLEDHLPALVERIVQEEVERVANRRR